MNCLNPGVHTTFNQLCITKTWPPMAGGSESTDAHKVESEEAHFRAKQGGRVRYEKKSSEGRENFYCRDGAFGAVASRREESPPIPQSSSPHN